MRARDVVRYVALPGIIPRCKEFSQTGFGWLAQLMALIYATVRLLPKNHPYLNPANAGKFGVRHVIAEAARGLSFKKENIDQLIVFFALLTGFVVLVLQFVMILLMFLIKPLFAGMFSTPAPTNDIAFLLLDHVLGIPNFFCNALGTCTSLQPTLPMPIHQALHSLFQFYSLAILLVAVLVFLYYVMLMVGETAQTGTPFGRRFSHIWAPLRLVVALGLLVPINYGLNSGQYIMLAAARAGSGFATNGWILFNSSISSAWSTNDESMIARTTPPDVTPLVAFAMLVSACKEAYEKTYFPMEIKPYLIKAPYDYVDLNGAFFPYHVPGGPPGSEALGFYEYEDVIIRFGHKDDTLYAQQKGGVMPFCGEIRIHTNDAYTYTAGGTLYGPLAIQEIYYFLIRSMLADGDIMNFGRRAVCVHLPTMQQELINNNTGYCSGVSFTVGGDVSPVKLPSAEFLGEKANMWNGSFIAVTTALRTNYINALIANGETDVPTALIERGGAAPVSGIIILPNGTALLLQRSEIFPHQTKCRTSWKRYRKSGANMTRPWMLFSDSSPIFRMAQPSSSIVPARRKLPICSMLFICTGKRPMPPSARTRKHTAISSLMP